MNLLWTKYNEIDEMVDVFNDIEIYSGIFPIEIN
jgi:hypothetical protein